MQQNNVMNCHGGDLHDTISLSCCPAAQSHLHMSLVLGIRVVLGSLGQLLCDDVLVQGDKPSLHFLLYLCQGTLIVNILLDSGLIDCLSD